LFFLRYPKTNLFLVERGTTKEWFENETLDIEDLSIKVHHSEIVYRRHREPIGKVMKPEQE
jgi:hypothetical protein